MHEIIETVDDNVVEAMYAVFQSLTDEMPSIVAFTTAGEPLTKEDFIARIRASHAAGKRGEVKTSEKVLEEIESW